MFLAVKSRNDPNISSCLDFVPFFNYVGSEPNTAAVSVSHSSRLRQAVLVSITSSCGWTEGAVGSRGAKHPGTVKPGIVTLVWDLG